MEVTFRKPVTADIPFLAETAIQAEKAGSDILSYTTIFGLEEAQAKKCIIEMMEEEMDSCCEYSISSFVVAEHNGKIVGATCAWAEAVDGMPSSMQKGNLLRFSIPKENFEKAIPLSPLLRELHIEFFTDSIHMGLAYVAPEMRGQGLVGRMFRLRIDELKAENPEIKHVYLQVFKNNVSGIRAYERFGFKIVDTKVSANPHIANYLPSDTKYLMKYTF